MIQAIDIIALTAQDPELCLYCFRLFRPGETYHQGSDDMVLCPNCPGDLQIGEDLAAIQATEHLAVDCGGGLIRVCREGATIIVEPGEVRYSADALLEAATKVVDEQVDDRETWFGPRRTLRSAAMALTPTPKNWRQVQIPRAT